MTPSQRRMIVPVVSLVLGVLLLAVTAWVTLRDAGTARPGGLGAVGGPFELTSQEGAPISDKDLRGRPYLIFFGFTNCPDVCPTALREISDVFAALGPDKKISALFVTIDPERDTAPALKDYVSNFDKRIIGVTGTRAQIEAVTKSFRAYAKKIPGEGDNYSMDHSVMIYLMDKQGRFVTGFNINRPPKESAAELARYL
jgi:protein SCO1/2